VEGTNLLITRETDYALRILRALSDGEQVTTGDICQRELLPKQFVYKILKKLEQAHLVQIARGADGGCRLIADLKKVNLYDLTEIMGADKLVSACMQPGFQCAWQKKCTSICTVHKQLSQIQDVMDTELRAHSLHQMLFESD
jgi:Rrf2 family protein